MRKRICVMQDDLKDCGVSSLLTIIKYHHGDIPKEYLREITKTTKDGVSAFYLIKAAQELGFATKALKGDIQLLEKSDFPLIAHIIINKSYQHFVVVYEVNKDNIIIADPSLGIRKLSLDEWGIMSTKKYLIFKPLKKIPKLTNNRKIFDLIFSFLSEYRVLFITIFLFSLIYTLLNIVTSYNLKLLLDEGNIYNSKSINIVLIILIVIGIVKNLANLFRHKLINYINNDLDNKLVNDIYNHIISLPYLYYKNRTCGDIITRINDISNIKDLLSKIFLTLFVDLVLIIFVLIMLFKINFKLSIIIIFISLLYVIVIFVYNKIIYPDIKKSYDKASFVNSYLVETISSIDTIKNFNIEDYICHNFANKYASFSRLNKKIGNILYDSEFFKEMINYLGNLLVMFLGIKLVIADDLSIMNLFVYMTLISYYFEPIINIMDLNFTFKNSIISIKRLMELYAIPCEKDKISKKSINRNLKGYIRFNNLSYSYNGVTNVLNGINIDIKECEKILICGGSGKGKSTLVKILVGYITDYEGRVLIDNRDLNDYEVSDIRHQISYISQDETLFTDTVYNNIVLNRDVDYDEFLRVCKLMRVTEIVKSLPLGYETLLEENGFNLSSGEKQRIILARTLLKKANIYIFDEALNAIDIKYERIIIKNIFKLLNDKTIIVVSHRFDNEDLFDRKINIGDINEC